MINDGAVPVKRAAGVYKITCTSNDKFYIGSAVNLRNRRAVHHTLAQKKKHHNRHLQNVWNKYGAGAFRFEVLLICSAKDAVMYEQRAIDTLKPTLNLSPTASSILGVKMSAETCARVSAGKKGKPVVLTHEQEAYRIARVKETHRALWKDPDWRSNRLKKAVESGILRRGKTPKFREGWIEEFTRRATGENNPNFGKKWSDSRKKEMSDKKRSHPKVERVLVNGKMMSYLEMSEQCGIGRATLRDRVHAGWSPERAMSEPASVHKKSEAHKAALSKARKGLPNPKRSTDRCLKAVCIGDTLFRSRVDAAAAFNVSGGTITNWVRRGCVAKGNGVHSGVSVKEIE